MFADVLGNLTSLEVLDLSNNQLTDLVSRTCEYYLQLKRFDYYYSCTSFSGIKRLFKRCFIYLEAKIYKTSIFNVIYFDFVVFNLYSLKGRNTIEKKIR